MTSTAFLLITSVGTLITALAALATVLEMRRQRRAMYKPEFVCKASGFSMRRAKKDHFVPFDVLPPGGDESSSDTGIIALDCLNIGLGPAKCVKYVWTFDAPSIVEVLANRRVDVSNVVIEHDMLKIGGSRPTVDGGLFEPGDNLPVTIHNLLTQKFGSAPVVSSGSSISVCIPSAYVDLFALSLGNWSASEDGAQDGAPAPLEMLGLEISYQDIEGKSYLKRFIVAPKLGHMSFTSSGGRAGELHEAEGSFQIRDA